MAAVDQHGSSVNDRRAVAMSLKGRVMAKDSDEVFASSLCYSIQLAHGRRLPRLPGRTTSPKKYILSAVVFRHIGLACVSLTCETSAALPQQCFMDRKPFLSQIQPISNDGILLYMLYCAIVR